MKITYIFGPTIFEIQEMLFCVSEKCNLRDVLPALPPNMSYADFLYESWCYLWYDAETDKPLGYTLFSSHRGIVKNRAVYPEFFFASTRFCELRHIVKIRRAMLYAMENAFKNRVVAYIDNERMAKIAALNKFKPMYRRKNLWVKEA